MSTPTSFYLQLSFAVIWNNSALALVSQIESERMYLFRRLAMSVLFFNSVNHIVSICFPDSMFNNPTITDINFKSNDCKTDSLAQNIFEFSFFIEYLVIHLLTYCYSFSIINSVISRKSSFSFFIGSFLFPIFVIIFCIQIVLQNQLHTNWAPTEIDVVTTSTTRCVFLFIVMQGLTLPFSYFHCIFELNKPNFSVKKLSKHFVKVLFLFLCNYRLFGLSKFSKNKIFSPEKFEVFSSMSSLCLQMFLPPALIFSIPELRSKMRNLELNGPIGKLYKWLLKKVLSIDLEPFFHRIILFGVLSEMITKELLIRIFS